MAVPVTAVGISFVQTKKYTATASLLFRDPAFDQKLFGSTFVAQSGDPARKAATNVRLVSLKVISARTAQRLGPPWRTSTVQDKVDVAAEGQSDIATINATDENPQVAAGLANAFAEEYTRYRRAADRATIREAKRLVERNLALLEPVERRTPGARELEQRARQLEVMETLQTGNAEIAERATPPTSPSSPNRKRNGLLGAILGLLAGLALAFAYERLDRRLRDPKELEELFEKPLLGTIPKSDQLGKARDPRAVPAAEAEAFRMLRANLRYFNISREIRSVLITSAVPGEGKTTTAWNLTAAAAAAGTRALLIEADLRRPSLVEIFEEGSGREGLTEVLVGELSLESAVVSIPVDGSTNGASSDVNMSMLFSGALPPNPTELFESDRMEELLREAEAQYDLVVIDTPPTSVVSDAVPLVNEVSGVIVVARLGHSTRDALAALHAQLENLDAPTLGVVVNYVDEREIGYGGYPSGYSPASIAAHAEPHRGKVAAGG